MTGEGGLILPLLTQRPKSGKGGGLVSVWGGGEKSLEQGFSKSGRKERKKSGGRKILPRKLTKRT